MFTIPAGLEQNSDDDEFFLTDSEEDNCHTTRVFDPPIQPRLIRWGFGHDVPKDDFRNAIIHGKIHEVQRFMDDGIHVDTVLSANWTGIMYAGYYCQLEVLRFLISRRANVNYCGGNGELTVLMATCASNSSDESVLKKCLLCLLKEGVSTDEKDRYGMTALMYAAKQGHVGIVEALYQHSVDLNVTDNLGHTALMWACYKGHIEVVRFLINKDALINHLTSDGYNACDLAFLHGHHEVSKIVEAYIRKCPEPGDYFVNKMDNTVSIPKQQVKQSDLEMFLLGLDLGNLVKVFDEHHITLPELLRMADSDLEKIGITQFGVRKKILDSITWFHKQEWQNTSLPNVDYDRLMTCPGAICMVSNTSKHMEYIATTIAYMADQIITHPDLLKTGFEGATAIELIEKTDEVLMKISVLHQRLSHFGTKLAKIVSVKDYQPVDLIKKNPKSSMSKKNKKMLFIICGLTGFASSILVLWKYETITSKVAAIFS